MGIQAEDYLLFRGRCRLRVNLDERCYASLAKRLYVRARKQTSSQGLLKIGAYSKLEIGAYGNCKILSINILLECIQ